MTFYMREDEKEQALALFLKFYEKYIKSEHWGSHISLVALHSRVNMELHLLLLRGEPIKTLDVIAAELKIQKEDAEAWWGLVVLKSAPTNVPMGEEFPKLLVHDDGKLVVHIRTEIIEGHEFVH